MRPHCAIYPVNYPTMFLRYYKLFLTVTNFKTLNEVTVIHTKFNTPFQ